MDPTVIKKLGLWSQGCQGCRAIRDGKSASNHTEECRMRFNEYMDGQESERFKASQEKMFKYYEEKVRDKSGSEEQ